MPVNITFGPVGSTIDTSVCRYVNAEHMQDQILDEIFYDDNYYSTVSADNKTNNCLSSRLKIAFICRHKEGYICTGVSQIMSHISNKRTNIHN